MHHSNKLFAKLVLNIQTFLKGGMEIGFWKEVNKKCKIFQFLVVAHLCSLFSMCFDNFINFDYFQCSPNLQVYNVFIDNLDPSLPRIALFARRNIAINEELTFDYQMTGDMTGRKVQHLVCLDARASFI